MASTDQAPNSYPSTVAVDLTQTPAEQPEATAVPSIWAKLGAEALGTFALVLAILGTGLYAGLSSVGVLGGALAAGLVLAGGIAAFGSVSGGHFNPAVSLGVAIAGRLPWLDMLWYWLAQLFGGALAAAVLFVTIPGGLAEAVKPEFTNQDMFATTANGFGKQSPLYQTTEPYTTQAGLDDITFNWRLALILELVATAIFVAVILGVIRQLSVATAPFAIGMTLAAMLLVTGVVTGGGLNPARSTAAALFSGSVALKQLWLFWLAPLLGAAIAGLFALAFSPEAEAPYAALPGGENDEGEDEDEDDEDVKSD
jgi:aquaporin Z